MSTRWATAWKGRECTTDSEDSCSWEREEKETENRMLLEGIYGRCWVKFLVLGWVGMMDESRDECSWIVGWDSGGDGGYVFVWVSGKV